eukprot:1362035-Prorocentrum_lima.AAC.1
MTSSLVGSEMCIRDRASCATPLECKSCSDQVSGSNAPGNISRRTPSKTCLLYTSDAADDM